MNPRYADLIQRADFRCEYCHAPAVAFNFPLEIEHIRPRALVADDSDDNLAIACRSCNIFKGSRIGAVSEESGETVRLYHPRNDRWEDHFEEHAPDLTIQGKTLVGRATVQLLNMNSEDQLFARQQWYRLELFP